MYVSISRAPYDDATACFSPPGWPAYKEPPQAGEAPGVQPIGATRMCTFQLVVGGIVAHAAPRTALSEHAPLARGMHGAEMHTRSVARKVYLARYSEVSRSHLRAKRSANVLQLPSSSGCEPAPPTIDQNSFLLFP